MHFLFFLFLCNGVSARKFNNLVADEARDAYPQTIGHAGASYYVPEESLIGYELAANLQADYAEPDLNLSQDGHFVVMHDHTLDGTTNVMDFPEFAARRSTYTVCGKETTGVFVMNLTLAEIKTLRIRQRIDGRPRTFDWTYPVPTFHALLDWQSQNFVSSKRMVGLMPELKCPSFYNALGYHAEDMFLSVLRRGGYHVDKDDMATPTDIRHKVVPIVIQSFQADSLRYLATQTRIPLMQLISVHKKKPLDVWNEGVLDDVKKYAAAVGPSKGIFTDAISDEKALEMVKWGHDRGLFIVPYTMKPEANSMAPKFKGNEYAELSFFYDYLQVGAVFHEAPDMARQALSTSHVYKSEEKSKDHRDDDIHFA